MAPDQSIWMYFADASLIVKFVMVLLLAASMASWTLIFQRGSSLKRAKLSMNEFEDKFWSGIDLTKLYLQLEKEPDDTATMQSIFQAGFSEFVRLRKQPGITPDSIMESVQRAMRVAYARSSDDLEQHLSFLATVGSTSPYVGLFGTVWGIMTSFHALGAAQQATIAMVAPGISEALVATAMGLFAAIPAVIAYNRFSNDVERLLNRYDTFKEEFLGILYRQAHASAE